MRNSLVTGLALTGAGLALLAVLSYEPANIVSATGLGTWLDEGGVVLLSLATAGACLAGGALALRFAVRARIRARG